MNKFFISCKESRIENNRSFYGCFYLGPFEGGQGLTVANALRRTLLSECTGLAIVSIIIENVHHEYSTLPGVRDSVLDILLNFKEIVLKKKNNLYGIYKNKSISSIYEDVGTSYFKPAVGYLKVKGPGIIRSKDLHLPPFIQCVDPNQYIATLGEDGFLNMKFIIMEGKNYIIGKSNRDSSLLKKRDVLLKGLKDVIKKPTNPRNLRTFANGQLNCPLKKAQKRGKLDCEGKSKKLSQPHKTLLRVMSKTRRSERSLGGIANESRVSDLKTKSTFLDLNAKDKYFNSKNITQLFLDAIFNPVTKVNYIIEVNENKIEETANKKHSLIEDITSLIKSNNELKKTFPFLSFSYNKHAVTVDRFTAKSQINLDRKFINDSAYKKGEALSGKLDSKTVKLDSSGLTLTKLNSGHRPLTPKPCLGETCAIQSGKRGALLLAGGNKNSHEVKPKDIYSGVMESQLEKKPKELIEYVENCSLTELSNLYSSLHPLKKENTTHNIILEIWTNGSLHPRDALSTALNNLSNVFLNLQKTKVINPIFKDWSSYKNILYSVAANTNGNIINKLNYVPLKKDSNFQSPLPVKELSKHRWCAQATFLKTNFLRNSKTVTQKKLVPCHKASYNKIHCRLAPTLDSLDSYKNLDISTLNISLRTYTKLKRVKINTMNDLFIKWNDISKKLDLKSTKEIVKSLNIFG